ncbi:GAF domain-containing sensor histidine kinase [Pyxidicoccus xibeiensis]|uniref:GAF domain-containing sensor histidine kinase n=1 Tax=Pyxidicoccus xibeiensis TaxID=2906759 RepID=UPI0020A82A25|nr:GAF domain-containing sensor histidine kinase [Pyxidicoccus xibeiensis]MCP3143625.1 GAF domain-containing sensor histidine kinase [Pyxidicoccus xibeiensis]
MAMVGDVQSVLRSPERLAALRRTALMDSQVEEAFDRFTRLACRFLHTPIALVSLLGEGRHFCKSSLGLPEPWLSQRELPLTHSICKYTVAGGAALIIDDVREEPELRDSPAVKEMGVRAYAGIPLVASGQALGTFCVVDTVPRHWTQDEVGILRDLAAGVMTELELRATRQLDLDVKARDEFLSIAAHELRTPLTPLKLQLETLRRSVVAAGLGDSKVMHHLERSAAQVQRLAQLVERLLDVSRVATGRLGLLLEEVDLALLATEVTDRFREEAESVGSQLKVHPHSPIRGVWDQLRLEQVLSSLISNAIKYGAGRPIDVFVEGDAEVARLCVKDRGIGLAREDTRRIFERFERAVSQRRYGGLGLGLYVARQIVEAHGGSIVVRSQLGQGSTFTVFLPTRAAPRQLSEPREEPAASAH